MYSLTSTRLLHSANAELVNVFWHMSSLGEKKIKQPPENRKEQFFGVVTLYNYSLIETYIPL